MTLAPAILRRWLHGSLRLQLSPTFNTENAVHGRDPITAQGSSAFVRIQHVLRWSAFKKSHLSPETMSMTTLKMMDLPHLLSSGVHDTCVLRLDRLKSSVVLAPPAMKHSLRTYSFGSILRAAPFWMASATPSDWHGEMTRSVLGLPYRSSIVRHLTLAVRVPVPALLTCTARADGDCRCHCLPTAGALSSSVEARPRDRGGGRLSEAASPSSPLASCMITLPPKTQAVVFFCSQGVN